MQDNVPQLLRSILEAGDKGYKGEITSFEPEPGEDNNFLYDAESSMFSGKFMDSSTDISETYDFEIRRDGDGWSSQYKIVLDAELSEEEEIADGELLATEADKEVPALTEPTDEPVPQLCEPMDNSTNALQEQIAYLQGQVAELRGMMVDKFMTMAFSEGRFAGTEKAKLQAFAEALYDQRQNKQAMIAFSEGEEPVDLFTAFSEIVDSMPKQAELFVSLSEQEAPELGTPKVNAPVPQGYAPDADGLETYQKLVQFAEANGLDINKSTDYQQALKSVIQ